MVIAMIEQAFDALWQHRMLCRNAALWIFVVMLPWSVIGYVIGYLIVEIIGSDLVSR